jgi:hypothetical protein
MYIVECALTREILFESIDYAEADAFANDLEIPVRIRRSDES